jgi:hypothetical protein
MHKGVAATAFILAISCAAQSTPKEAAELAAYPLTMDHVARHYQTLTGIALQCARDLELKREFQGWEKLPLDQQIAKFTANGKTSAIAKTRGITPRDQVMTMQALKAVMTAFPSIEQGQGPNQYNKLEYAASSPEHVKFFRDHQTDIMKLAMQFASAARSAPKQ